MAKGSQKPGHCVSLGMKHFLVFTVMAWMGTMIQTRVSEAHPTPYQGATILMFNNYQAYQEFWAGYAPLQNFSIAERLQYYREFDAVEHRPQLNYRFFRSNDLTSQANGYLMAGSGFSTRPSAGVFWHSTLELDWESRRYYTSAEVSLSRGGVREHMMQYRVGVAPYEGEYESLNTWAIFEARYTSMDQLWELTPFLRFYYHNVLWEVGANQRGAFRFNFMMHL